MPTSRSAEPTTPVAVLDLAVKLKHEAPRRTAAQVAEVISASEGWRPSARTIQRLFARLGLNKARRDAAGGLRPLRGRRRQ